jgi:transcriptional regulator with XRE-family HTH domain
VNTKFILISKFVREKRTKKNISQEALSQSLGYKNAQMISNVERGLAGIPPHCIKKLSELLEVPSYTVIETMVEDYRRYLETEYRQPNMMYKTSKRIYGDNNNRTLQTL